jgi:hypothetical protein
VRKAKVSPRPHLRLGLNPCKHVLGLAQSANGVGRNGLPSYDVPRKPAHDIALPGKVLHQMAGHLHKVDGAASTAKMLGLCPTQE